MVLNLVHHLSAAARGLRDVLRNAPPVQDRVNVGFLHAHVAHRVDLRTAEVIDGVALGARLPVDVLQGVERVLVNRSKEKARALHGPAEFVQRGVAPSLARGLRSSHRLEVHGLHRQHHLPVGSDVDPLLALVLEVLARHVALKVEVSERGPVSVRLVVDGIVLVPGHKSAALTEAVEHRVLEAGLLRFLVNGPLAGVGQRDSGPVRGGVLESHDPVLQVLELPQRLGGEHARLGVPRGGDHGREAALGEGARRHVALGQEPGPRADPQLEDVRLGAPRDEHHAPPQEPVERHKQRHGDPRAGGHRAPHPQERPLEPRLPPGHSALRRRGGATCARLHTGSLPI